MTNSDDCGQIALLRDALDHIARIATAARQPTKRLDWIASRAKDALRGQDLSGVRGRGKNELPQWAHSFFSIEDSL